jgi:hypothetical protein
MLSAVLKSERAVQMSILIVRAFVKLRELLASHKELARKIEQIEAPAHHPRHRLPYTVQPQEKVTPSTAGL